MTQDTQIGGPSGKFPATRWSAVRAARSNDPARRKRALETIIAAYWKPIYKYIRIRWGKTDEDAKDLTQEFFARLIGKQYLGDFDPSKARLRTFLRVSVDHFVSNEVKAAKRLKRGGAAEHISLDFVIAARGEIESLDARSDTFSLGAILQYLLTSLSAHTPPQPLSAIACKGMAADREDRYMSSIALGRDIGSYLDGLPVSAYPENIFRKMARWASRYRVAIVLVLTYLVVRALLLL